MFTIHSALVAHQSPPLRALVSGRFKESVDGSVEWDEIEESTFTSLWQYVYTGDYDTPEVCIIEVEPDVEEEALEPEAKAQPEAVAEPVEEAQPVPEVEYHWGGFNVPEKKKRTKTTKQEVLWNDFRDSWTLEIPTESIAMGESQEDDKPKVASFGDVFVHHAQVYVLADRYDIVQLMNVSCRKLHTALLEFDIEDKGLDDIVMLLNYCWGELIPERLKDLTVHYAACIVEKLWHSDEFRNLLATNGSFSEALIGSMLLRLG